LEDYSIPALVFGVGVTLTGVLRTLGQAGVQVYAVCDRADIATHSRWYQTPPGADTSRLKPANLAAYLETCRLPRAVLIPCSDDWARAVASIPQSLQNRFLVSGPSLEIVDTMVDKWKFSKLLDEAGVVHPKTRLIERVDQMQQWPDETFHGAFLKPLSSAEFARRHGVKGFTVDSRAEAIALLGLLDLPVMLQEYIPGPPSCHYFVEGFRDYTGTIRGMLARQRLRMFPLDLGNSSLMISVALDEVAPADDAQGPVDLGQQAGHGGLAGAGVPGEHQVAAGGDHRQAPLPAQPHKAIPTTPRVRCGKKGKRRAPRASRSHVAPPSESHRRHMTIVLPPATWACDSKLFLWRQAHGAAQPVACRGATAAPGR